MSVRVLTNRDEYASPFMDRFGINLSDDELNTILAVRARHGVSGFFTSGLWVTQQLPGCLREWQLSTLFGHWQRHPDGRRP
jgi:hypothetical protein